MRSVNMMGKNQQQVTQVRAWECMGVLFAKSALNRMISLSPAAAQRQPAETGLMAGSAWGRLLHRGNSAASVLIDGYASVWLFHCTAVAVLFSWQKRRSGKYFLVGKSAVVEGAFLLAKTQ